MSTIDVSLNRASKQSTFTYSSGAYNLELVSSTAGVIALPGRLTVVTMSKTDFSRVIDAVAHWMNSNRDYLERSELPTSLYLEYTYMVVYKQNGSVNSVNVVIPITAIDGSQVTIQYNLTGSTFTIQPYSAISVTWEQFRYLLTIIDTMFRLLDTGKFVENE